MSNSWYARYPGDYGRDTAHLSMIEHGAYGLLLDHYYSTAAPLPADVAALYRICRAFDQSEREAVDCVVSQFFDLRDDGYHNVRADMELVKRNEHHKRLSTGARKTNEKRWNRLATRSATRSALASPQPQPYPQKETSKSVPAANPAADTREFDAFWEAYPKKLGKAEARKAWVQQFCDGHLGEILASLEAWKTTEQWSEPEFIPFPATWLNKGRHKETPAMEERSNGNGRAKPESFDEKRRRESAAAISKMHNRAVSVVHQVDRRLPDASSNGDADGDLRGSIVRSNPRTN